MSQPTSLTLRLTLLFSIVATIVFLSFGWIMERSIEKHFEMGDIKELKLISNAVIPILQSVDAKQDAAHLQQRFDDILIGHHHPLLRITDSIGKLIYNSPELDLTQIPIPLSTLPEQQLVKKWQNDNNHYRILFQPAKSNTGMAYTVMVAISTDFHQHFIANFRLILWGMVLLGIFVMGLMSWLAVRYGHRPLRYITDQISHISSNELSTRLDPHDVPIELSNLATSFNDLLMRMDKAFDQLSNFSADIAHELRTPVTNLMTQTQVALSRTRSNEEYQEVLYSNMEEFERLSQMIADMLFLAKTDNKIDPIEMEDVDLEQEIHSLFDYYEAWAEENGVSLIVEGSVQLQCNRLMLRRAISNLLSNAIRYTRKGQDVTITLSQVEYSASIVVQNPGEPILTEHLSKLFDRFYRVDPSRQRISEGTGLGLAITKSIVEAHGGSIHATSDESKTQFQIIIPIDSE
ncbi:MAG: heavy metal sensor histidine kinase [Methylophaga sp.]|nr:heavy metal sensor histidine kinase [Methylophaga sp.]